jgi:hypothetical protein
MNTTQLERREWLVTALIVAFFTALILIIWNDFHDRMTQYTCDPTPIIVQEGDTIYALVRANCIGALEVAVDDNVMTYGTNLQIGQQIFLQSHEDCAMRVTDGGEVYEDC